MLSGLSIANWVCKPTNIIDGMNSHGTWLNHPILPVKYHNISIKSPQITCVFPWNHHKMSRCSHSHEITEGSPRSLSRSMVCSDICRDTPKSPSLMTPWSFSSRFMVLGANKAVLLNHKPATMGGFHGKTYDDFGDFYMISWWFNGKHINMMISRDVIWFYADFIGQKYLMGNIRWFHGVLFDFMVI